MKNIYALCGVFVSMLSLVSGDAGAAAARATAKQSVIQKGTTVRAKVAATGLYDQECYDAYYGCMDQFCITDNADGGSCACSDKSIKYEKQFVDIQNKLAEAERVATVEVEKVKAGANADIIFTGTRKYDKDGNVLGVGEVSDADSKAKKRADLLAMFDDWDVEEEDLVFGDSFGSVADLTGDALKNAAEELCLEQVPESCAGDMDLLRQMYSRQIVSDCKAFENMIASKSAEADLAMANAESDVRNALKESFESANKYDLGQCMVEFKKCMRTEDACGENWENCVSIIASENMQNNLVQGAVGTTVATVDVYDITASTMEMLNSKRIVCERVLDSCVAVRDNVWPAFLREAAPTIRVAESAIESKYRQSCLTDISDCIQTACKDDIVGKGKDTMDACLSRPDMARSFCKVEIDRCERMEPLIWGYVKDKLAAMRVDACTQEVKDCFTADTRCGANFQNCIGMDYDYIHDICPIDSLVVCKANNPSFSMDDLDSMLMGLYLNIDNAALDNCQNLIDVKMAEICGSTTDCNRFAADDTIGTGSLRSQKDGNLYRVTGMISFGSIKMGKESTSVFDAGVALKPGQIGVEDYIATIREKNADVPNAENIILTIEEELNDIAAAINRTIELIEVDPEIQYCINGRDLSQITGKKGAKTEARFPNLLNKQKTEIAEAALRKAQNNYDAKYNQMIAEAARDAKADVAQYLCQKMAVTGVMTSTSPDTGLAPVYAISYDVGTGLTNEDLVKGGHGVSQLGGVTFKNDGYLGKTSSDLGSGTKEVTAIFNRDTRTCRICTTTVTQNCKTTGSKSWFHNNRNVSCETSAPIEKCEDIQM